MSAAWSEQIERRYALRLTPELRSWFDDQLWQRTPPGRFRQPLPPAELLEPPPGLIWSGFMLPDTLPLVNNEYGDWLCLRVGADDWAGEILCWSHGGGDWTPCGPMLADALLYGAAYREVEPAGQNEQPGCDQAHAPEAGRGGVQLDGDCDVLQWARGWLARAGRGLDNSSAQGTPGDGCLRYPVTGDLLAAGIAEVPIRRDRTLRHLASPLKAGSDPNLAEHMNVRWDTEFVRWIFDTDLIPLATRETLARLFDQSLEELLQQDWASAEAEALAVSGLRGDLGWPFDVAGWAAERRGEIPQAVRCYDYGLRTSLFADDSVRFRTHWFPEGYGKFAAARLAALRAELPHHLLHDEYLDVFWQNDAASLRVRLSAYWLRRAREHYRCAQYLQAFHCFYQAGWDCGLSDLDGYAEILDGLGASAAAAGASALTKVVEMHRRHLSAQSGEAAGVCGS